jgi:hypothetical protein
LICCGEANKRRVSGVATDGFDVYALISDTWKSAGIEDHQLEDV